MNSQMKRFLRQGADRSWARDVQSLWNQSAAPSQDVNLFPNSAVSQLFKSFYRAQTPAHADPVFGGLKWGRKFPPANHSSLWWPAPTWGCLGTPPKNYLISMNSKVTERGSLWITKEAPITQEITSVFCVRNRGQRQNIFYYTKSCHRLLALVTVLFYLLSSAKSPKQPSTVIWFPI